MIKEWYFQVNKMVFEPNQADDPLKFTIKSSDPSQPTSFLAISQNKDEKVGFFF